MNSEPYRALLTEYILHNITTKQTYQIRDPNGRSGASRKPPKRKKAKRTRSDPTQLNTKPSAGRSSVHHAPLLNHHSTALSMEDDAPRVENLNSALERPSRLDTMYGSMEQQHTRRNKRIDDPITELNSMANALEDECSSNYGYASESSSSEDYTEFENMVKNLRKIGFFPAKDSPDYGRKFDQAIERFKSKFPGSPVPRSSHAIRKPQLADQVSTPISKTETIFSVDHQD